MAETETSKKKSGSENRQCTDVLHCRVKSGEAQRIKKIAEEMDVSVSELLRESALDKPIKRRRNAIPLIERQLLAQLTGTLGSLGCTLGRLSIIAEHNLDRLDTKSVNSATTECRELVRQLINILK